MRIKNSKSLTPKDLINLMDKPNFVKRIFKEHKQIMETEIPSTLKAGPENRPLFKHSRVNLSGEDSTIINASYIQGFKRPNAYIATETPQSEVGAQAIWETVWQHQTNIIVMLNKPEEDEKGYLYWNSEVGKSLRFGKLTVNTIKFRTIVPTLKITNLKVTNEKGDSLTVYHILYLNWQFHDVLPPKADFLKFLLTVSVYSESVDSFEGHLNPIMIHCSNGLDRTMVYCAIDRALLEYVRTKKVNFFSTVKKLRQECYKCLSNTRHYYFCYSTLHEYFANRSSVL